MIECYRSYARLLLAAAVAALSLTGQTIPNPAQTAAAPDQKVKASEPAGDPLHRESPQSAVAAFLELCRSDNYERARRYLDLQQMTPERRLADGPQLAQQLEKVLDRATQFDPAAISKAPEGNPSDGLPANRERIAAVRDKSKSLAVELERRALPSGISVWVFSADTVARIPQMVQLSSDSFIERLLPPPLVVWTLMGTPLWRWIALILLLIGVASLSGLTLRLVLLLVEPVLRRLIPKLNRDALLTLVGPLRTLLAVAVFRIGLAWISPAARLNLILERACTPVMFLGLVWLAAQIVDIAAARLMVALQPRHQTFSYSVLPLASRVLKITILMLGLASVLSDWGYNTTTILAGLGLGGVAIALAAQKTVENLFGGISVISDRPVVIGDACRFGDRVGVVEDIGLRSTRIRTPERTLMTVPNALFSSMTLENFTNRDKILLQFMLNLRRDTTPDQVRTLLESIKHILAEERNVESGSMPVRFVGIGTYSLDVEVGVYVLTREDNEFFQIRQELLLRILDAVEDAGTALAVPTQASITYSGPPNGSFNFPPQRAAPRRS